MMAELGFWAIFGLALAGAGFGAGFLGGLFGGGGGMIVIPVLYHVFGALGVDPAVRMHLVVGTSLAAVVPLSILGARSHWRQGNVELSLLKPLMPAALLGALAAGFVGRWMDAHVLAWLFATVVAFTAWNMVMRPRPKLDLADGRAGPMALGIPAWGLVGAGIGCVSTLVGIGGGHLDGACTPFAGHPDAQRHRHQFNAGHGHRAAGCAVLCAGRCTGRAPAARSVGYVNLVAAAMLFAFGSLGVSSGARLTKTVDETLLRRLFALLLAASAMRMLLATA